MKNLITLPLVFFFAFFLIPTGSAQEIKLSNIKSWGYQLQNVSISEVRHSRQNLMIIDPEIDDDPPHRYTKDQVIWMKNASNPKKKKLILAYTSIGEAEEYRPYWQRSWKEHPPDWLGKQNAEWKGNYKVRFWYQEWQTIILKEIEKSVSGGFDGIYLDIIDAWEYWADEDTYTKNREQRRHKDLSGNNRKSADLMIDWIAKIAQHARKISSRPILLFPQNGEELLLHASESKQTLYWQVVSGIGAEDVFHYGENSEDNPLNINQERLRILQRFPKKNKLVLSVEYLTEKRSIMKYVQKARSFGFIPCISVRELDKLVSVF